MIEKGTIGLTMTTGAGGVWFAGIGKIGLMVVSENRTHPAAGSSRLQEDAALTLPLGRVSHDLAPGGRGFPYG